MAALDLRGHKANLRQQFRERRRDFISENGDVANARVHTHLRRLLSDLNAANAQVCGYRALTEEATLYAAAAWYYPRVTEGGLEFRRPHHERAFVPGAFGIAEPDPDESSLWNENVPTFVCCPAVAVDWQGGRLGLGKSYYDRFFTRHPACVRIGVVFQVQVAKDPLPAESWDQSLDWIVTEHMILRTSKRRP